MIISRTRSVCKYIIALEYILKFYMFCREFFIISSFRRQNKSFSLWEFPGRAPLANISLHQSTFWYSTCFVGSFQLFVVFVDTISPFRTRSACKHIVALEYISIFYMFCREFSTICSFCRSNKTFSLWDFPGRAPLVNISLHFSKFWYFTCLFGSFRLLVVFVDRIRPFLYENFPDALRL